MKSDFTDSQEIAKAIGAASAELFLMHEAVAEAKQVLEYSNERAKRAFSVLVNEKLKESASVAKAEHAARASDSWAASLADLSEQYKIARKVTEKHAALVARLDALRSLLSFKRETMRELAQCATLLQLTS